MSPGMTLDGESRETPPAPPSGSGLRMRIAGGALLVALLSWLGSGIYTVESTERGVVTRFGRFHGETGPGIHVALPWPIDRVETPSTTEVRRMEVGYTAKGQNWIEHRRSDMLTGDQNILKLMMTVQYKIRNPSDYLFGTTEPDWLVERTVESTMASFVGSLQVDDVLTTAKAEIEIEVIRRGQELLDAYRTGIILLGGNLQVVSPPAPVMDAFNDVTRAKKDSERLREDARMYRNTIVPQAQGEGQEIVNLARGNSEMRVHRARGEAGRFSSLLAEYERDRTLTKTRLYLETMEKVLDATDVVIVEDGSKVTILEE